MESLQRSHSEYGENQNEDKEQQLAEEFKGLLQSLPSERQWIGSRKFYLYQNFWCPATFLDGIALFQNHFQARDSDVILTSCPKSGTTWLKALIFSIANRHSFDDAMQNGSSHVLARSVHDLIPTLETDVYQKNKHPPIVDLASPRLLSTHVPFGSLPDSIKDSKCKIVYVCRDPLDLFVSLWHFIQQFKCEDEEWLLPMEEAFDMFCRGIHGFGPFWDHVLGYWNASLMRPGRILFLRYEAMKEDPVSHVKSLAEFIGFPFMASTPEEEVRLIKEIIRSCGIENLRNLKPNNSGIRPGGVPNHAYFRKGEVGDWANHLSPDMAERLMKIVHEKFDGSGLSFWMS